MPTIKVLNGHTLSQLANEMQLFEAADLNGIGITEALVPGVILTLPEQVPAKLFRENIAQVGKPETTRSLYGQAWVDIALQQLGTEERLFELCDLNDAGITDVLIAGTTITSPEAEAKLKRIVNTLKANKPSSVKVYAPGAEVEEGIEFWAIEMDFLVS
jgi:hypothetical protein